MDGLTVAVDSDSKNIPDGGPHKPDATRSRIPHTAMNVGELCDLSSGAMAEILNSTGLGDFTIESKLSSSRDTHWMRAMELAAGLEELGSDEEEEEEPMLHITGVVVSSVDNEPISDAQISLRGDDGQPLIVPCSTEGDGSFALSPRLEHQEDTTAPLKLTVKHPEFAPTTTLVFADAGGCTTWLELKVAPASASAVIPSSVGGCVEDPASGMSLTVPANAFLTKLGFPFKGSAKVSITCIDPSNPDALSLMPGDWSATDISGSLAHLRTFGAMHVSLADSATGESLNLRPGCELDAEWASKVPLDMLEKGGAGLEQLPCAWQYHEASGKWRQDPVPISVDGMQLPKPEQVHSAKNRASEPSVAPRRTPQKKKKGGGKKKKKGTWYEQGDVDQGMNDWSVEQFKKLFASKQGQRFKMKVSSGGWYNIDSPYLAVLMQGTVLCNGHVLSVQQEVKVQRVNRGIDLNGDLLHQGIQAEKTTHYRQMGAVCLAITGVDYAGKTFARARPSDGVFEVVCQHESEVRLEVQVNPEKGNTCTPGKSHTWHFGPFKTGSIGDVLDVGTLQIDLSSASRL